MRRCKVIVRTRNGGHSACGHKCNGAPRVFVIWMVLGPYPFQGPGACLLLSYHANPPSRVACIMTVVPAHSESQHKYFEREYFRKRDSGRVRTGSENPQAWGGRTCSRESVNVCSTHDNANVVVGVPTAGAFAARGQGVSCSHSGYVQATVCSSKRKFAGKSRTCGRSDFFLQRVVLRLLLYDAKGYYKDETIPSTVASIENPNLITRNEYDTSTNNCDQVG